MADSAILNLDIKQRGNNMTLTNQEFKALLQMPVIKRQGHVAMVQSHHVGTAGRFYLETVWVDHRGASDPMHPAVHITRQCVETGATHHHASYRIGG